MSIDLEGARCEEEAARLLPWYVSGRISGADRERVSRHLEHCAVCRNDMAQEQRVQEMFKADTRIEYAPQAGLAKVLSRIDELARDAPAGSGPAFGDVPSAPISPVPRRAGVLRWLAAAVVVQAIALGWLGGVSLRDRDRAATAHGPASYQTLALDEAHPDTGPHIRAVFAPAMTLADLSALLAAKGLIIVRGPSTAGAYTLAFADPHVAASTPDATVAELRRDAHVLFVEPAVNDAAAAR